MASDGHPTPLDGFEPPAGRREASVRVRQPYLPSGPSGRNEQLHHGGTSPTRGELRVARHERSAERLAQGDEGRVVCREVRPELPHPVGQPNVRIPDDREIGQIHPNIRGPVSGELAAEDQSAERVEHLDVDEMDPRSASLTSGPPRHAYRMERGAFPEPGRILGVNVTATWKPRAAATAAPATRGPP